MEDHKFVSPFSWQPMCRADLRSVNMVADLIHIDYPEDESVFAERLNLYPEGCFVYSNGSEISGYIISHPGIYKQLPELNSLLNAIPEEASTYYLHDIALLPRVRQGGAASVIVEEVISHAESEGFRNASLVAVNNSTPFWQRHGFQIEVDPHLEHKLKSYDDAACFMVRDLIK